MRARRDQLAIETMAPLATAAAFANAGGELATKPGFAAFRPLDRVFAGGQLLRGRVDQRERVACRFTLGQGEDAAIGAGHGREVGFAPIREFFADALQSLALLRQFDDAGHDRIGIRIDEESVDFVGDALDIGAHARGDHRHAEIAQLRQRVAEGLGHGRHQHRGVGGEAGEHAGQFLALVVEHDVHARAAEERMRIRAGAEQEDVGMLAQARQYLLEQLRTLAAAHAARDDQAQARARRNRAAARRGCRPWRQPVRDHRRGQRGQWRGQAQVVGQRRAARRGQGRLRGQQGRHGLVAQPLPVAGIGLGEFAICAERGQVGAALRLVEGQRGIAEVAMQDRPQRVVVVDNAQGRQAAAQDVEAMADQGGDDDRVDRPGLQPFAEQVAIGGIVDGGFGDRAGQGDALQRRPGHRAVMQFEPFAVALARVAAPRDQHQMACVVETPAEIAHPAFGAAAPAMQHVQHDRSAVEAGQSGRHVLGQCRAELFAQAGQRRGWLRIARVGVGCGSLQGTIARGDVAVVEQNRSAHLRPSFAIGVCACGEGGGKARAVPCGGQRREFGAIDEPALRMGETECVDAGHVGFAVRSDRQRRALAIEIVERAGGKHIVGFERTQQPRQGQRRQIGVAAQQHQAAPGQSPGHCFGQHFGPFVDEIGQAQRLRMPGQGRAGAEQGELRSTGQLRPRRRQPGLAAGSGAVHAEADGIRRQFRHDRPVRKRTRIIGDGDRQCHERRWRVLGRKRRAGIG